MLKTMIIGNIGKDAIVNEVGAKKVINFSVCDTQKFKDGQGNMIERQTWVDCAKWGDQTAVAQYLKKGGKVYVEGYPEISTYQTKTGETKAKFGLRVERIELLGGRSETSEQQPPLPPVTSQGSTPDDDLPF